MSNPIKKFINVRPGEWLLTILMFLNIYFLLVTYYLLKPVRDSLFLIKLGPEQLPVVYILIALLVVPVTDLYSRAGRRLKLNQLTNLTTLCLILSLLALRWLVMYENNWIFFTLYIWVSIYGILSTSQFWLLANAVFDPSQAKRLFVLLNLGSIIGAFTGGEVTNWLVKSLDVPTIDLLWYCMGFLAVTIVLVNAVWNINRRAMEEQPAPVRRLRSAPEKESMTRVIRTVTGSRHLMLIVGVIAFTMATESFVDFQFKAVTTDAFPVTDDLTSFLGRIYGRLSLVSLILQGVFAQWLIRRIGVGGIILFLPMGLLCGTALMLIQPGLLAGILLRGADSSLKYSVDKTGRELLFLPVPLDVKKRTKVFIDMFVDRWFRGVAGAMLLLFYSVLGFSVRQLSLVMLVMLAVWILIALLARREYINAFRLALQRRRIDIDALTSSIHDPRTLETLKASLASANTREVSYALEMLLSAQNAACSGEIRPLLKHASVEIRRKALLALQAHRDDALLPDVESMLHDSDAEVRLEAMHYLYGAAEERHALVIRKYLEQDAGALQSTAVLAAARFGAEQERGLITGDMIDRLLEQADADSRMQAARALGELNRPGFYAFLRRLMQDEHPGVVKAAIAAAGCTRSREFIPDLLQRLTDPRFRTDARDALAGYRRKIIGTLYDLLIDDSVDYRVRRGLPGVLARIATQDAADALAECLPELDATLRYETIKALNKMRVRNADLRFDHRRVEQSLYEETRSYYEILGILELHRRHAGTPGSALLERALGETLDRNLEKIFRMLGLRYPPRDIYNAYQGLVSRQKNLHASAVEFLDNLLGKDLKRILLPILDDAQVVNPAMAGAKYFGVDFKTPEEALRKLLQGRDNWLKTCALYSLRDGIPVALQLEVQQAARDADPVVRETAELILKQQ